MAARRNYPARPHPRPFLALALTLLAFVFACGGDDPAPTPRSPATGATIPAEVLDHPTLADAAAYQADGRSAESLILYQRLAEDADATLRAEAFLGAAVAHDALGNPTAARHALEDALDDAPAGADVRARAAYLLSLHLSDEGDHEAAAETVAPYAEGADGPLAPYLAERFASASARAGNTADAVATWDRLLADDTLPRALRPRILTARADAYAADGDIRSAFDALAQHVALTGDPGSRFLMAEYARELGDTTAFAAELRALVADAPASRFALLAIEELRRAGEPVDAGEQGYVYYRHGDYEDARATLEASLLEPNLTPAQVAFRTYYLAASYEDDGMPAEAIPLYDEAAAAAGDTVYAHNARYWAAHAAETLGDDDAASDRYRALARDGPPGQFSSEAAFRAGYVLYQSGDPSAAVAAWEGIDALDPRLAYWRGRALQATGNDQAVAALEAAAAAGPRSFYGIEAARALGDEIDDSTAYEPVAEQAAIDWGALEAWLGSITPGALPPTGPPSPATSLAALGLRGDAVAATDAIAAAGDPWALLAATREADSAGLTTTVIGYARRLQVNLGIPDHDLPRDLQRLLFPLRYVALLNDAGEEYAIDPLVLAAVIQQESLWNPRAVSIANARGLMQVIPGTGDLVAAARGMPDHETADLFQPGTAILFGAHYLADQLELFGTLAPALAAYNAGPGNADDWAAPGQTPADLVAVITFDETQTYVQAVTGHLAAYRAIYRDAE